jgi:hypothetical protein
MVFLHPDVLLCLVPYLGQPRRSVLEANAIHHCLGNRPSVFFLAVARFVTARKSAAHVRAKVRIGLLVYRRKFGRIPNKRVLGALLD